MKCAVMPVYIYDDRLLTVILFLSLHADRDCWTLHMFPEFVPCYRGFEYWCHDRRILPIWWEPGWEEPNRGLGGEYKCCQFVVSEAWKVGPWFETDGWLYDGVMYAGGYWTL